LENLIRLAVAVGVFGIMVTWEKFSPRRSMQSNRKQRWPINLGLAVLNMGLMRFTIGSLAYLSAVFAAEKGWGLLQLVGATKTVAIVATLLLLDFAIYVQHIGMHKSPLLWSLHKVHHADLAFDATTAVRFHPLEIMVSMLYKALVIVLIGAHPAGVIAFEIILNAAATFNHSNINLPEAIESKLRWLLITPDLHRIHHSTERAEQDSNFGFSVSWWDRLCRTYTRQAKLPQTDMLIGLPNLRIQDELSFTQLLLLPFKTGEQHNQ
jgi:sterol desaturase/sphingolipid hydroxylase (fatty acid hydroxylase superfamily)